ncbi:MAG: divalent-cation tolerance protein CutA [Longimicrobiales bacterium]
MTAPDAERAAALVRTLVEERLAACGNIIHGITSIYRWSGAIHEETEVLIILKTTAAAAESLAARVPELHPYDVPEVVVLPVLTGHPPYLDWVRDETSRRDS